MIVWRLHSSIFLEPGLHALTEQRAIRQDDGGMAIRFEQAHDQCKEEIGGLARLKVLREVAFDPVFLLAAKGRIGEHNIYAIGLAIADVRPR